MSKDGPEGPPGLFDSLKTLTVDLLLVAQTRLDLLAVEFEEERERLSSMLVLTAVALFCLGVGVVLLCMLLIVVFWDSYRLQAIGAMAACFLLIGGRLWSVLSQRIRDKPGLFSSSRAELAKDRQALGGRS